MISITVSDELAEHYQKVVQHRDDVLDSSASEDKDKVAALNAVTTILKDLARLQESIYSTESIAELQQAVIRALQEADQTIANTVLNSLEKELCSR
jgi:cell division protein ZapA (FtsZ GTPase activity inhibitor)